MCQIKFLESIMFLGMVKCAAFNCTNYWGKKTMPRTIKFHRFPKNPKMRKEWIKICGKGARISTEHDGICSEHFEETDYRLQDLLLNTPLKKRHLKKDAIPKLFTANVSHKKKRIQKLNGLKEPEEDPLSLHDTPVDDSSTREWVLTELVVEPIHSRGCLTNKEYEKNDLLETAQESTDTEEIEVLEKHTASGTIVSAQYEQSKKINKLVPGIAESAIQTQYLGKEDKAVQTEIEYEVDLEFRIMYAEAKARQLKIALNKAIKKRRREENKEKILKKIFSPGQLKRLREPGKKFNWSNEDQIATRELYSAGIRSYEMLRQRGFPLPGTSLQRKWASKAKLKSDSVTEIVSEVTEIVPEVTEIVAAPKPVSAPESALDTEIVFALEAIFSAEDQHELAPEPELIPTPKSIKQNPIEMYWTEFINTIE